MTDVGVTQALADLTLSTSTTEDSFPNSPRVSRLWPPQATLPAARRVSLFSDLHAASAKQLETAQHPGAGQEAWWSAVVGDVFQAVVERLPAHTAQHAMLVCRQWHDSVTNGLVCLRPRALRLNCISSRSVFHAFLQHAQYLNAHCALHTLCWLLLLSGCLVTLILSISFTLLLTRHLCFSCEPPGLLPYCMLLIMSTNPQTQQPSTQDVLQVCIAAKLGPEWHCKATGRSSAGTQPAPAELSEPRWL